MARAFISLLLINASLNSLAEFSPNNKFAFQKCNRAIPKITLKSLSLKEAVRRMWMNNVIYMREYIIALTTNSKDTPFIKAKLTTALMTMSGSIAPFYGPDVAKQLAQMLNIYVQKGEELLVAIKRGMHQYIDGVENTWKQNAANVADLLITSNNRWTIQDLAEMFDDHLRLTQEEMRAYVTQDTQLGLTIFDVVIQQAMHMADCLSYGIIGSFPERF